MLGALRDKFHGRGTDDERIGQNLQRSRLASIVGPPGIGKTRLAREWAARHGSSYERVVLVSLTSAATLGAALTALGAALDLEFPALAEAELPDVVGRAVARIERTLVVLDNFEQLTAFAPALLPKILAHAPSAHVLVTSRHRLRLADEIVHELRGLSFDDAASDAVALLADRVAKLRGSPPTAPEIEQLRQIAERLEGVPLALELAAVKIATLGAKSVLGHLGKPLALLNENVRDSDAAQSSMRHAVARSWELLGATERSLLAACSVFRGGFELDAVTEVHEDAGVLDAIHELSEKSLLSRTESDDGSVRFFLYENIREFAAEHLDPEREASLVLRHAAYYIALGSELARAVAGISGAAALDALEAERVNLLAICERALGERRLPPEAALRALVALAPLALARGPIAPLVDRLDEAIAAAPGAAPAHRIAAYLAAARGHRRLGHAAETKSAQESALALASSLGDAAVEAEIRSDLAMTLVAEGAMEDAQVLLSTSPRRLDPSRDRSGAALDDLRLAMAQRELGDLQSAQGSARRALEAFQREGNAAQSGLAYGELAHVAMELGDLTSARDYLTRGVDIGAPRAAMLTDAALTGRLGMLAEAEGELERAETLLSAAVMGLRRIGYRRFEAGVAAYLAVVELEAGFLERARDRLAQSIEMLHHDPRAQSPFAGFLSVVELARGNLAGARRAASLVGPLRPRDPLSVTGHLLTIPLDRAERAPAAAIAAKLALAEAPSKEGVPLRSVSYDVRLALKVIEAVRGDRSPSIPDVGPASAGEVLEVSSSGAWFRLPGEARVDCRRFRALRLLLVKLAEHRLVHPTRAVSWEVLVEAGWPGERILPTAARNRLKVAMASLRKLGLRDVLVHDGDGYFLDAKAPMVVLGE